jgi:hypothetical protein
MRHRPRGDDSVPSPPWNTPGQVPAGRGPAGPGGAPGRASGRAPERAPEPESEPTTREVPAVFARASVPVSQPARKALREPTAELPVVPLGRQVPRLAGLRAPAHPSRRQLSFGWGMSATGFLIAFVGWGVWAASNRGRMALPLIDFGIVLVVAVGVFILSRVVGRVVLEAVFHRPRRSARLAHALTGLFLAAVGVNFLARTSWIIDGLNWLRGLR